MRLTNIRFGLTEPERRLRRRALSRFTAEWRFWIERRPVFMAVMAALAALGGAAIAWAEIVL